MLTLSQWVAQLSTHDSSINTSPGVITHSTPLIVYADLHSAFIGNVTSCQLYLTVCTWSCKWNIKSWKYCGCLLRPVGKWGVLGGSLNPSKRFYIHHLTVYFKCLTVWRWSTSLAPAVQTSLVAAMWVCWWRTSVECTHNLFTPLRWKDVHT